MRTKELECWETDNEGPKNRDIKKAAVILVMKKIDMSIQLVTRG